MVEDRLVREIEALETIVASRSELLSAEQEQDAVEVIKIAKERIHALESQRKALVEPLNRQVTAINREVKPYRDRLQAVEKALKAMIAASIARREAANREAVQAATQAARTGGSAGEHLSRVDDSPIPEGTGMRKRWQFTVTDSTRVPFEFLSPDPAKIAAYLDQYSDFENPPVIPGVEVSVGAIISVRR